MTTDTEARRLAEEILRDDNAPYAGPDMTVTRQLWAASSAPTLARAYLNLLTRLETPGLTTDDLDLIEQARGRHPGGISRGLVRIIDRITQPTSTAGEDCHGLDTPERVRFYEHDFYPLSNFSAFNLKWEGELFATSEAAYHWEKFVFRDSQPWQDIIGERILNAESAHVAFKVAEEAKALRRVDWDREQPNGRPLKVNIMKAILIAKVQQHEYVRRKLLATGDRELVEDSWRDDFWGWGPNRDGQNMLGKLWMEVRAELRASVEPPVTTAPAVDGGGK